MIATSTIAQPGAMSTGGISVSIDRVQKIFETRTGDEVVALDSVDLRIAEGEFVAVVGPSGCGKSTLLAMVAGIESPTRGHIRVDGKPMAGPDPRTSVVFQNDYLLPWRNVYDNILLPLEFKRLNLKDHRAGIEALLNQVGLAGFANKFPSELSGGMRQRVAICRAMIQEPGLLLMDEPFGALDALTREQMIMDLQNIWLRLGNTVFFITHGIDEAVFLADRVIVMTPRPGCVDMQVTVDLPRPRQWKEIHANAGFTDAVTRVRQKFEERGVLTAP
jgi:NitT/TauT family transport system ATP-binding protein